MGSWDELCLLCGIYGGPCDLVSSYGLDDIVKSIVAEINSNDPTLFKIIEDALRTSLPPSARHLGYAPEWLPAGMGNNGYSTRAWVAVGSFNSDGEATLRDGQIPDPRWAEVRRVRDGDGGDFGELIVDEDGDQSLRNTYTVCSVKREEGKPNFFFCERCYACLENWLDRDSLPSPSGAPGSDCELSFASELYEIVNSRKAGRDENSGLLAEMDYDGIEDSLNQWQTHLMPCRRGSQHIAAAIAAGLRGSDLLPAVLRDCRAWMFMRPDIWPEPPKIDRAPTHVHYPPRHDSVMPLIGQLPNELLLPILHDLPLPSLLSLSATCRSLRNLITEPDFLDRVLKEAITRGSLRWILPLEGLLDENQRAYNAVRLWLPEAHRPDPILESPEASATSDSEEDAEGETDDEEPSVPAPPAPKPPMPSAVPLFMSPHLDRLAFVRACWASDSMMNRKRLWGQVRRFEKVWEDHRLYGRQVDRFYTPDEPLPAKLQKA